MAELPILPLSFLFLVLLLPVTLSQSIPPYPSIESELCLASPSTVSSLIDITHSFRPDLPKWVSDEGLGSVLHLVASIPNGDLANESQLNIHVHTGTHVDAPSHIFQEYFASGDHVDTLDIRVLNGLALVVDVPRHSNITAEVMQSLHIPYGVERVIFRTLNTDRRLMWNKAFDSSYVGFTPDGAQWLKENTMIKLIGVDYLSAAAFDSLIPTHVVLLKNKDTILVEGLNLDNVDVGLYQLHCLPLILRADGSPIRCILEK